MNSNRNAFLLSRTRGAAIATATLMFWDRLMREGFAVLFDASWYTATYPDVETAGWDARYHYLTHGRRELRSTGPYFDADWYALQARSIGAMPDDLVAHYLREGSSLGLTPSPYFDSAFYIECYGDAARVPDPLLHYATAGWRMGYRPSLYLDREWYTTQYPRAGGIDPLVHYRQEGSSAGYWPNPYFDPDWYRSNYPDVAAEGVEPLWHYIVAGAEEGRDPGPALSANSYLIDHPEAASPGNNPLRHCLLANGDRPHGAAAKPRLTPSASTQVDGGNATGPGQALANRAVSVGGIQELGSHSRRARDLGPLFDAEWYRRQTGHDRLGADDLFAHYLSEGASLGLDPSPYFDTDWYLKRHAEFLARGTNPLVHYVEIGWHQGLDPSPYFRGNWYRSEAGNLATADMDPLAQYLTDGWRLGLDPSPLFNVREYLDTYPAVAAEGVEPLRHYIERGSDAGLKPNPYFDPAWYRQAYPDIVRAGIEPLWHYCESGAREGRDPGPQFQTSWYRARYLSAEPLDTNPLEHHLLVGRGLGHATIPPPEGTHLGSSAAAARVLAPSNSEPYTAQVLRGGSGQSDSLMPFTPHPRQERAVKAVALYLPQFHPIPENDKWWGKGFTDWTNVSKAVPQFVGQYQPRLPRDLGFYDLRVPEVLREQVELAHNYGIAAFCFHYYWFGGRRLLERPLDAYFADSSLDLPYCVSWANENWTRRWDGEDTEILIAQSSDPDVDAQLAASLVPLLRDDRYLRLGGLPLLMVYRASQLADAPATLSRWRQTFLDAGVGDVLIASAQWDDADPRTLGFDVAVEYPPHKLSRGLPHIEDDLPITNPQYRGTVYRYSDIVDRAVAVDRQPYPLIRGVMPGWDNTARSPEAGTTFHGATPQLYRSWLESAGRYALANEVHGESIVFINAWNEWAEAAYLEPDRNYGHSYLESTHAALVHTEQRGTSPQTRIAVVVHDAQNHGAQRTALNLSRTLTEVFDMAVEIILLDDGPLRGEFDDFGTVHRFASIRSDSEAQMEVLRTIWDRGTSIAICNTVVTGQLAKLLHQMGFRVVSLVHELPGVMDQLGLLESAQAIGRHSDKIVFPSEYVHDEFLRVVGPLGAEALVRPQGLYRPPTTWSVGSSDRRRARAKLGMPVDSDVVLAVGYADLRKGIDIFMRVFEAVLKSRGDVVFVWLGCEDQELIRWFSREAEVLGHSASLRLVPRVADVGSYYEAASVLLLPSREDPFPSVVLEALSHAVPVVGFTKGTGSVDIIKRGAGVLVPYGDAQAMASEVVALLEDPDTRLEMGSTGRDIVRREFDWTHYVADLLAHCGYRRPSVSVVVPNYNYEQYIHRRLESIIHQDYPIKEVIVLDDASTDDSVSTIEAYLSDCGHPDATLLVNATNSGSVFDQWAKGVERASGDLVWIAEADDYADPGLLSKLVPLFDDSRVVMAYCESRQVDMDGQMLAENYHDYVRDIDARKWLASWRRSGLDEIREGLSIKNTIPNVSAVLFRRERLSRVLSDEARWIRNTRYTGDWATYVSMLSGDGGIGFVARSLNNHRRHSESVTLKSHGAELVDEIQRMQREIDDRVSLSDETQRRGKAYVDELRTQFGLV